MAASNEEMRQPGEWWGKRYIALNTRESRDYSAKEVRGRGGAGGEEWEEARYEN